MLARILLSRLFKACALSRLAGVIYHWRSCAFLGMIAMLRQSNREAELAVSELALLKALQQGDELAVQAAEVRLKRASRACSAPCRPGTPLGPAVESAKQVNIGAAIDQASPMGGREVGDGLETGAEPLWMLDSSVTNCHKCSQEFDVFRRKHHCRGCGLIFCDSCSAQEYSYLPWRYGIASRVCDECFDKYALVGRRHSSDLAR